MGLEAEDRLREMAPSLNQTQIKGLATELHRVYYIYIYIYIYISRAIRVGSSGLLYIYIYIYSCICGLIYIYNMLCRNGRN